MLIVLKKNINNTFDKIQLILYDERTSISICMNSEDIKYSIVMDANHFKEKHENSTFQRNTIKLYDEPSSKLVLISLDFQA